MAVRPPEQVLAAIADVVAAGRSAGDGLRFTGREQWHLTLQFLGPVPELAPVMDGLAAMAAGRVPFPLRLGGAGAFPTARRARVVWIGPAQGGEELVALAEAVSGALGPLGFGSERGPFRPHLTVARMRVPGDAAPVLAALGAEPVGPAFTVGEVVLYESRLSSRGPAYSVLGRVSLGDA